MIPTGHPHEDPCCPAYNGSQDPRKKRAVCRYYQKSNCRRGSNCPFAHIPIAAQAESPTISHPAYPGENMYTYYSLGQTPVYLPLGSPTQPIFLWRPYPLSPSFDPRYGLVCRSENLLDYPDDKSDPSSAESSSTATTIDYQHRMGLDTAWLEGVELGTLRSVAGPPGDHGANLSPSHASYSHPVFHGPQVEHMVGGNRATSRKHPDQDSMVALPFPFLLPCQDDPKKKPLAYKTKPCKFYTANGKCRSGEKCMFIHDPEAKGNAKKPPAKLTLPNDAKLPPKPINRYDDYRARDFYPIAWRVIGGGVMMGGQRQICPAFIAGQCKYGNDCRLAHETELETDEVGYIEPKREPVPECQASPQQGTKDTMQKRVRSGMQRKFVKAPPAETSRPVIFPSTTPRPQELHVPGIETARKRGDQVTVSSAPPSPVHRRTRSLSMVTSPPTVDTAHSNYAAEL